ncbi:MAG: GNAT family N-acetyltransferase [Bifidobacteriaceae bacterium]|nr:GNAT family N-acetyltransferase [Bifidobacteriaceae bacterium]
MKQIPSGYSLVRLGPADLRDAVEVDLWAFPAVETVDEMAAHRLSLPFDRALGCRADDGQLAALCSAHTFVDFPVPGHQIAAGGFTWMAVHPEHRRRGLASALINRHLADCAERGEAISALIASEPEIYGRFGYGTATWGYTLSLARRADLVALDQSGIDVTFETLDPEVHAGLVHDLHRAAAGQGDLIRPGWVSRTDVEAERTFLTRTSNHRRGLEPSRIALAWRGSEPVGYAVFARKELGWTDGRPDSKVMLSEIAYLDRAVAYALWSRLLDMDLTAGVMAHLVTPSDAIFGLLVNLSAAQPRLADTVWLRLVNVAQALAARRYQSPVDLVIQVEDSVLPANSGKYHLTAAAFSQATVDKTSAPADLIADSRALAAAYLGGTPLTSLASSGRVSELTPGALARAGAAFGWPVPASTSWIF